MHRIGYRFIENVASSHDPVVGREEERRSALSPEHRAKAAPVFPAPSPQPPAPVLVGREAELDQLHHLLGKAVHGERQLVFVTGEAGMGKTALVETFLGGMGNWKVGSASTGRGRENRPRWKDHNMIGAKQLQNQLLPRVVDALQLMHNGWPN